MTRSIDQISFDALTPGVRDNSRTCPACAGVGVLTATDLFCGAGGSSLGLEKVRCPSCGRSLIEVKYALNIGIWRSRRTTRTSRRPIRRSTAPGRSRRASSATPISGGSPRSASPPGRSSASATTAASPTARSSCWRSATWSSPTRGAGGPVVRTQQRVGSTLRVTDTHGHHMQVTGNHRFWCKVGSLDAQPQWLSIERALEQPTYWARPGHGGVLPHGIDPVAGTDPAGYRWDRIESIVPDRVDVPVFNIEAQEDHSYVAEGIVVANCTNYSSAKGAKDNSEQAIRSRATFNDIIRFVGHWKYSAVFVENVVEARLWCDERGHDPQCRCGATFNRWYQTMLDLGYDGEIVYFNSQFSYPTPSPATACTSCSGAAGLSGRTLISRRRPGARIVRRSCQGCRRGRRPPRSPSARSTGSSSGGGTAPSTPTTARCAPAVSHPR